MDAATHNILGRLVRQSRTRWRGLAVNEGVQAVFCRYLRWERRQRRQGKSRARPSYRRLRLFVRSVLRDAADAERRHRQGRVVSYRPRNPGLQGCASGPGILKRHVTWYDRRVETITDASGNKIDIWDTLAAPHDLERRAMLRQALASLPAEDLALLLARCRDEPPGEDARQRGGLAGPLSPSQVRKRLRVIRQQVTGYVNGSNPRAHMLGIACTASGSHAIRGRGKMLSPAQARLWATLRACGFLGIRSSG